MKPDTLEDILDAKQARRARLAALSIDEKIDLIEKLQEFGRTMMSARESLPQPPAREPNPPGKQASFASQMAEKEEPAS